MACGSKTSAACVTNMQMFVIQCLTDAMQHVCRLIGV